MVREKTSERIIKETALDRSDKGGASGKRSRNERSAPLSDDTNNDLPRKRVRNSELDIESQCKQLYNWGQNNRRTANQAPADEATPGVRSGVQEVSNVAPLIEIPSSARRARSSCNALPKSSPPAPVRSLVDGSIAKKPSSVGVGYNLNQRPSKVTRVDNTVATKQKRSLRLRSDKIESKSRGTLRNLSEHPQNVPNNPAPDIPDESEDDNKALSNAAKDAMDTSTACSGPFWKEMEPIFRFISSDDVSFLKQQESKITTFAEDCDAITDQVKGGELETGISALPLSLRLCAAMIDPNEVEGSEGDMSVEDSDSSSNAGLGSTAAVCTELQYSKMSYDQKLLLELQSIEFAPDLQPVNDEVGDEIKRLENELGEQAKRNQKTIKQLTQAVEEAREVQERDFERIALDKLMLAAYAKYKPCRRSHFDGRTSASKLAKQKVLSFTKRALARYHTYKETGKSCFSEPQVKAMFSSNSFSKASKLLLAANLPNDVIRPLGEGQRGNNFPLKPGREVLVNEVAGNASIKGIGLAVDLLPLPSPKRKRTERNRNNRVTGSA